MRSTLFMLPLVCSALSTSAFGQTKMTIDDLKELERRTLVVELPTMEEWLKPEDGAALDGTSKSFLAHRSYLDNIEKVARENWTFNDQVVFMSRGECYDLFAQGSKDHMVLMKGQVGFFGIIGSHNIGGADVLVFQRTDEPLVRDKKGDVELVATALRMYPAGKYEDNRAPGASQRSYRVSYTEASLTFSFAELDKSLRKSLETGELRIFPGSARQDALRNCKELKGRSLIALQNNLDKGVSEDDLRKEFGGAVEFVPYDELMAHYVNKTEGKAVLFTIPGGVSTEGGQIIFRHIVMDTGSGRILGLAVGSGALTMTLDYKKITFKKLVECEE